MPRSVTSRRITVRPSPSGRQSDDRRNVPGDRRRLRRLGARRERDRTRQPLADLLRARLTAVCAWSRPALSGSGDALTQVLREEAERIASGAVRMARRSGRGRVGGRRAGCGAGAGARRCRTRSVARRRRLQSARRAQPPHGRQRLRAAAARGRRRRRHRPSRLRDRRTPAALLGRQRLRQSSPSAQAALALAAVIARSARVPLRVFGVIGPELVGPFPATLNTDARAEHVAAIEARERIARWSRRSRTCAAPTSRSSSNRGSASPQPRWRHAAASLACSCSAPTAMARCAASCTVRSRHS